MLSAEGQVLDELEQGHCSGGGTVWRRLNCRLQRTGRASWDGERRASSESLDLKIYYVGAGDDLVGKVCAE